MQPVKEFLYKPFFLTYDVAVSGKKIRNGLETFRSDILKVERFLNKISNFLKTKTEF